MSDGALRGALMVLCLAVSQFEVEKGSSSLVYQRKLYICEVGNPVRYNAFRFYKVVLIHQFLAYVYDISLLRSWYQKLENIYSFSGNKFGVM